VADMKTIRKCRNSEQDVLGDTHRHGGMGNIARIGALQICSTKFYFVFLHSALYLVLGN
jgi:hypothetical protein